VFGHRLKVVWTSLQTYIPVLEAPVSTGAFLASPSVNDFCALTRNGDKAERSHARIVNR